jgi:hypothetical protein
MKEKEITVTPKYTIDFDEYDPQLADEVRQVIEFHKLYLNYELECEKLTFDQLNARIAELKSSIEIGESVDTKETAKEDDGFYF